MVKNRLAGMFGVLAAVALVVGCGQPIDPSKAVGTWRLTSGNATLTAFSLREGQFTPLMAGRTHCTTAYRIERNTLIVAANLATGCRFAEQRFEIDSLTETEMVISLDGVRIVYQRARE